MKRLTAERNEALDRNVVKETWAEGLVAPDSFNSTYIYIDRGYIGLELSNASDSH